MRKALYNIEFLRAQLLATLKLTYGSVTFDGSALFAFSGAQATQAKPPVDYAKLAVHLGDGDVTVDLVKGKGGVVHVGPLSGTISLDREKLTKAMEEGMSGARDAFDKLFE